MEERLQELWALVKEIPSGKVTNYGALGNALHSPVSGLLVGRWLANCPEDVPWWRVVGKDGKLPIWKKDPNWETIQRDRLAEEGVPFSGDCVNMAKVYWEP